MSTKGHIYYDNNTEAYDDSVDRTINLEAERSAVFEIHYDTKHLYLYWDSQSMPERLKIDIKDISRFNFDVDGLIITMQEDTWTGQKIWKKEITDLAFTK